MALIKSITCLSILSLILLTTSSSPPPPFPLSYQNLDVSASLQQALQSLSPNTPHFHPSQQQHSLSMTLVSRSSLRSNDRKITDYASLTLSRLARDEARVDSLSPRYVSRSTCNPKPQKLETPVTSGAEQGSGEYLALVGFGRPVKEYYLILDTGSDVAWLQCLPCTVCYPQPEPIYNPAQSSTYHPLSCSSRQCAQLQDSTCLMRSCIYELAYGDGSSTIGNFATETLTFGSPGPLSESLPEVAFGCGHDNMGMYAGAAGLLGLGGGPLSLPSQINATSFSYCLVNSDSNSSSTLEFNSVQLRDSVTTPLVTNPYISTYRYVNLTGIIVGGRPVNFPPSLLAIQRGGRGGMIVDSGTTVTRLPTRVYDAVRDQFRRMARDLVFVGGFSILDTCYDFSSMSTVRVPTVAFQFAGGKTLPLPAENYLIPADGMGVFCFAFAGTSSGPSIIGNVQQQGMRVSFDLARKIVGFSPNKC